MLWAVADPHIDDAEPHKGETIINLRQLRYFIKVVEFGNMTRAAEALHVAQPALGLQIRQLEEDLSVELLVRHSRGVSPTPAGDVLFRRANEILRAVAEARDEMRGLARTQTETVVLGLTPSLMGLLGTETMLRAKTEMPHVALSLVEGLSFELLSGVEKGEIDLALAYEAQECPGLVRHAVLEEDLLFVTASDRNTARPTIPFAEAIRHSLVLAGQNDAIFRLATTVAARLSLTLNIAYEAKSVTGMRDLVRCGAAASILPFGTIARDIHRGELRMRRIVEPRLRRTLFLVHSAAPGQSHKIRALDLFMSQMLQELLRQLGDLATPMGTWRADAAASMPSDDVPD